MWLIIRVFAAASGVAERVVAMLGWVFGKMGYLKYAKLG